MSIIIGAFTIFAVFSAMFGLVTWGWYNYEKNKKKGSR
jgi:hypothetical protein